MTCISSSSETFSLRLTAVQPSPTSAGVFGMQRTILTGFAKYSPIHFVVLPATMLTTSCCSFTVSVISSRTTGS